MAQWSTIVVGVDGSDTSRKALQRASEEAQSHQASLTVLMAWEPPPPISGPYGRPPAMELGHGPQDDVQQQLSATVRDVLGEEAGASVTYRVVEGQPAKALVDASAEADLVVVGTRGHGGFVGLLLGSTSQQVVAHAHSPVLVVR
jgi:nucleotide-binding universal stress UspA family protein